MTLTDLLRRPLDDYNDADYPEQLECAGNRLPLHYKFEPADEDDGVTITVPLQLLSMLNIEQLYWCIPGWRLEKVTELLRALPKAIRKNFVPVPTFALQAMQLDQSNFSVALAKWISQTAGIEFTVDDLYELSLPVHLQIYVRVTNLEGKRIAAGRDLKVLQRDTRPLLNKQSAHQAESSSIYRTWQFDSLPEQTSADGAGVRYTIYPSLEDRGDGVALVECATLEQAQHYLRFGVLRLLILSLPQQYKFLRQQITANRELSLLAQGVELDKPLADAVAERIFQECFLADDIVLPRSRNEFDKLMNEHRSDLDKTASRVIAAITLLLTELRKARQLMSEPQAPAFVSAVTDANEQLLILFSKDFLRVTPTTWFAHLPRYAQALVRRLERLRGNASRDVQLSMQISPFVAAYKKLRAAHESSELEQFKWMIEEFRVSLFAQDLKTAIPVSSKRLSEQLVAIETLM